MRRTLERFSLKGRSLRHQTVLCRFDQNSVNVLGPIHLRLLERTKPQHQPIT